eukprot:3425866-Prymnesium_polylepis.1
MGTCGCVCCHQPPFSFAGAPRSGVLTPARPLPPCGRIRPATRATAARATRPTSAAARSASPSATLNHSCPTRSSRRPTRRPRLCSRR